MNKIAALLIILFLPACAHSSAQKDAVFQNAPIDALMAGCYAGTMSVGDLKERGDFGLGTLDALDGEMVALGGSFYQIKQDGKAELLQKTAMSPFATLVFFKPAFEFSSGGTMNHKELAAFLDEKIPSPNLIYAVKIDGLFTALKVRSAARQEKPYRVLTEAISGQKIFELKNIRGTLVGFRYPAYMEGVNVPGYHFHFLSADKTIGGHVLDLEGKDLRIEVDQNRVFLMELPGTEEFMKFRFEGDSEEALAKVEK